MARVFVRNRKHPNVTTFRGKIVHKPTRDGYPDCGYVYGGRAQIYYTDESPTCVKCLSVRCAVCNGLCFWSEDAWVCTKCGDEWYPDHGPEYAAPGGA